MQTNEEIRLFRPRSGSEEQCLLQLQRGFPSSSDLGYKRLCNDLTM